MQDNAPLKTMRRIDDSTPRDVWIVAGMAVERTEANPSGWWEATVMLHGKDSDDPNDNPLGTFASIMHYNGRSLVGGFRGPLTHWRPLSAIKMPRKRAAKEAEGHKQEGERADAHS